VAVRTWKADVRRDLGGDLSRAQETILEAAAQRWVILASLDDYIARQSSLVTKKRWVLDVVTQRMQIAEGLAKHLVPPQAGVHPCNRQGCFIAAAVTSP